MKLDILGLPENIQDLIEDFDQHSIATCASEARIWDFQVDVWNAYALQSDKLKAELGEINMTQPREAIRAEMLMLGVIEYAEQFLDDHLTRNAPLIADFCSGAWPDYFPAKFFPAMLAIDISSEMLQENPARYKFMAPAYPQSTWEPIFQNFGMESEKGGVALVTMFFGARYLTLEQMFMFILRSIKLLRPGGKLMIFDYDGAVGIPLEKVDGFNPNGILELLQKYNLLGEVETILVDSVYWSEVNKGPNGPKINYLILTKKE